MNDTVLRIRVENTRVGVLHLHPNLVARRDQISPQLPCIILAKPLPSFEDHDGKRFNRYRLIKLPVYPTGDKNQMKHERI